MSLSFISFIPLVPACLVLRKVLIRGEQIRKIKDKSDQILNMICGDDLVRIPDASVD